MNDEHADLFYKLWETNLLLFETPERGLFARTPGNLESLDQ